MTEHSEHDLPEMTKVTSSNLKAIGYDGKDLFVEFNSGGIWRYEAVPERLFTDMKLAQSVGRFFITVIQGKYQAFKVPAKEDKRA